MQVGTPALPWIRLGLGLLQGLALFWLYHATEQKAWPATDGFVFAPAITVAIFIPTLIIAGAGNLRWRVLILWAVVATALCAGLAVYDLFRAPVEFTSNGPQPRIAPSPVMWVSVAAILFIAHALIVAGEGERRVIAAYPTLVDISWKHGLQFVLAVGFVAVLWGVLFLGAELFRLIRIEYLAELIRREVFWIPVTALAFSYAIHITDVRASIVQGTQTVALILLSWLLPLMALLAAAFVVALPFTGLEPLWATRRATSILLVAAAALVFLINAAYQHGRDDYRPAVALRYAGVVAALVLVPLIILAGYGLKLRIDQYALTPERINALACVVIAACYGLGYAVAAVHSGGWMRGLERTNVVASLAIIGVLLVLRSPIADPDRISVASQVGRLLSGQVSPENFDFAFLRFRAGRYGTEALERLAAYAEGPQAAQIAERARKTLSMTDPRSAWVAAQRITPEQRARNIKVIQPSEATLPADFVQQDWNSFPRNWLLPRCLVAEQRCEAVLTDINGDALPDILLFSVGAGPAAAFTKEAGGHWEFAGQIANAACAGVLDALREGRFKAVPPLVNDIEVNGRRLRIHVIAECGPS
jgi:hypothetical protein